MNFEEAETPPRAWGRLSLPGVNKKPYRNTPTCVGKTQVPRRCMTPEEKHPHVRGEDTKARANADLKEETPPRAWGRPSKDRAVAARKEKHPHVRGEDSQRPEVITRKTETPPRAWGRQQDTES